MLNFGDTVKTPTGRIGIVVSYTLNAERKAVYHVLHDYDKGEYWYEHELTVIIQNLGGGK